MQTGTLVEWLVADGTEVKEGQPIYNLEIEKSVMEIEAPASGVLRQTGTPGEEYSVGAEIGAIE